MIVWAKKRACTKKNHTENHCYKKQPMTSRKQNQNQLFYFLKLSVTTLYLLGYEIKRGVIKIWGYIKYF